MTTDFDGLSDNARRWVKFFHLESRSDAASALRSGFVAPGKRPGFTKHLCEEINSWANTPPESARSTNVVALSNRG